MSNRKTLLGLSLVLLFLESTLFATPGDIVASMPTNFAAPVDITYDSSRKGYWVTSFLETEIRLLNEDLDEVIASVPIPFESQFLPFVYGIASNPLTGTLFVLENTFTKTIYEFDLSNERATRSILLPFDNSVSRTPFGIAFDPTGDNGNGSLYVCEHDQSQIWEIDLDGTALRVIPDAADEDHILNVGKPFDVHLGYNESGELETLWVASPNLGILKLDRDGNFTGEYAPTDRVGTEVSGFVRGPYRDPVTGEESEVFVTLSGPEARLSILDGSTTAFGDITRFRCAQRGNEAELLWNSWTTFDRIEVLDHGDVIATLSGDATRWQGLLVEDGIHRLSLRTTLGDTIRESPACLFAIGLGQPLSSLDLTEADAIDLAWDGDRTIFVSVNNADREDGVTKEIRFLDLDLQPAGRAPVSDFFAAPEDTIGALAFDPRSNIIYVYNHSKNSVGLIDRGSGQFLAAIDVHLPGLGENIPRRKQPITGGMTFRAAGDAGQGTLLLIEARKDTLYEIDISGEVVGEYRHPYAWIDDVPPESTMTTVSFGVSMVTGANPEEVLLSAGLFREGSQPRLFRMELQTGQIIADSEIPTVGLEARGFYTVQHVLDGALPRVYALDLGGRLFELDAAPASVASPTLLSCQQRGLADAVDLDFTRAANYDSIEIFRDGEPLASMDGGLSHYVDNTALPGEHDYGVRGLVAGVASDFVRCTVRVGRGAVLGQHFTWPVEQPRYMAMHPDDGSFYIIGKIYLDDDAALTDNKVHHFSPQIDYLETREMDPPSDIVSVSTRGRQGFEPLLAYIIQDRFGEVSLFQETLGGAPINFVSLSPPEPPVPFRATLAGLTWNRENDTFFYHERITQKVVEIDADSGVSLRTIQQPIPAPSRFVSVVGLWHDAERRTLWSTAVREPGDSRVRQVVEFDLSGTLTGLSAAIPAGISAKEIVMANGRVFVLQTASPAQVLELKAITPDDIPAEFLRGDPNADERVNLADPLYVLNFVFRGGADPICKDAADANDDGRINVADPLYLLNFIFRGGPEPFAPYPAPGPDPTQDDFLCFDA